MEGRAEYFSLCAISDLKKAAQTADIPGVLVENPSIQAAYSNKITALFKSGLPQRHRAGR
jgi:hypothetical protein